MVVHDLRTQGPVINIYGPNVAGESIDVHPLTGHVVTGSYRVDDAI